MTAYSKIGLTRDKYNALFVLEGHWLKLRRRKPSTEFALLFMILVWSDQDSLLLIVTPRYFT